MSWLVLNGSAGLDNIWERAGLETSNQSTVSKAPTYEKRLILFLDFLGFKEIVDRTVADEALLGDLIAALRAVPKNAEATDFAGEQVTQFSDSLVISYPFKEPAAVYTLVANTTLAIVDLVDRGFLVRGAMTVGDLLHTDQYLVGPAMVRAYEMESKEARYPRVLVDSKVLRTALENPYSENSPEEEAEFIADFLAKDVDGRFFLDYTSWNSVVEAGGRPLEEYPAYVERIARLVEGGLGNDSWRVQEKYIWLHDRYIMMIDDSQDRTPGGDPTKPSLHAQSMPRFETLVKAANKKVAKGLSRSWPQRFASIYDKMLGELGK